MTDEKDELKELREAYDIALGEINKYLKLKETLAHLKEEIEEILKDEFAFSVCDQSEECQEHKKELERKLKELLEK